MPIILIIIKLWIIYWFTLFQLRFHLWFHRGTPLTGSIKGSMEWSMDWGYVFYIRPVCMMMIINVTHLQGFKYFALYLRGREELICRVLNEPMVSALTKQIFHNYVKHKWCSILMHKKFNETKAVIKGSKCSEPTKWRCLASMVQKIPRTLVCLFPSILH